MLSSWNENIIIIITLEHRKNIVDSIAPSVFDRIFFKLAGNQDMHRILDDFDFGSDRSIGSGLHLGQIGVLLQAELHALDYRNFSHRLITGENVVDMIIL